MKLTLLTVVTVLALLPMAAGRACAVGADTVTPAAQTAQPPPDKGGLTAAFLARFPPIPGAVATRIGNSSGGTTLETPVWNRTRTFPDGAPIRLAIPHNASHVGLEWSPDGKTALIRIKSGWNEGGYHDTWVTPEGKAVAGTFDFKWPRNDHENRTQANGWEFSTGLWIDYDGWHKHPLADEKYRDYLPFVTLKPGPNSGYPGYSWESTPSGLVIKTPKTTIYGLGRMETAVTDPANANLVFTQHNSHVMNWGVKGNGKEEVRFSPSLDPGKYPMDPRIHRAGTNPGPLKAVRSDGDLYIYSGENEVMLHRWDEKSKLLVPVAVAYLRPDGHAANLPGLPTINWGQGIVARAKDGRFTKDSYTLFSAKTIRPLWIFSIMDVDPEGVLYFLPTWREKSEAGDGVYWKTLDVEKGVFHLDNQRLLVVPDAMKTADQCAQMRIDWKSGDLVAVVQRKGVWNLERFPKWRDDPKGVKAAYSVGPVALSLRRDYPWWSKWSAKWGASVSPDGDVPLAGFGTMAVSGDYVFIAEAQAGGVRIHRLSDGKAVGRVSDRLHTNSTIDLPTQIQVEESPTEYRVFLMDFHGKSTLVWRIPKASMKAAVQ